MALPALIGIAGVLVAAVVTGMLAGRCVRRPRIHFVVWTAATLGLTIALTAQSVGFASGFGPATFRAVQLLALVLVPLWLAWGLVELVVPNEAVRFGMRLVSGALTVVVSVILATDPLSAQPFSQAWPLTGPHFQPISHFALDVVQVVAVVTVLASMVLASTVLAGPGPARARMMAAVVPVGLAALMLAGLRLGLPAAAYPLLSMLAAALVWFGASRAGEPAPEAAGDDADGGRGDMPDDGGRHQGRPDNDNGPYGAADGYVPHGQYVTSGPPPLPPDRPAARQPRPYGRILIFTLLEDRAADFDRIAEQAAEQVRTGEPDTLVYVIHLVPNAPLQRIFYEIYRDRAAFESHESQPYMQHFAAERRSCVLATNSIELRLKYAKVAPLPNPQPPPPGPVRPPRPYPPCYDQPRYDQPRYPQQVPSAGRRYGGG